MAVGRTTVRKFGSLVGPEKDEPHKASGLDLASEKSLPPTSDFEGVVAEDYTGSGYGKPLFAEKESRQGHLQTSLGFTDDYETIVEGRGQQERERLILCFPPDDVSRGSTWTSLVLDSTSRQDDGRPGASFLNVERSMLRSVSCCKK